ncbi:hypothetical protein M0R45_006148 [Rubus argutus]|uniref:Uncharacterized protein n=1 Tax=Rubus argutus TaxID=59490 RepID=A0AAW1YPS3_RUBAR
MRYSNRVKAETDRIDQLEFDDLEMDDEEIYIRKLEAGTLYSSAYFHGMGGERVELLGSNLHLIAVILGHLWCSEHPQMRGRIELLLKQQKLTKKDVKDILQEYHDNIGDMDGPEEKERSQAKIQKFISAF